MPPCGEGTYYVPQFANLGEFSPPYGDGTENDWNDKEARLFSPPCGDSTLNISQNTAKLKGRMARKHSLYYNDVLLR